MRTRPVPALAAAATALLIAVACTGGGTDGERAADTTSVTTTTTADCRTEPDTCSLPEAAEVADVLVGAAVAPERLDDPAYARLVAEEFNSVTPENHMKWPLVHPEPDVWDYESADRIVDFAEEHELAVRGHTLVWGQDVGNGLPDWVAAIDDPDELQAVVDDHIATLVGRYAGRVDRWDVVNEPLELLGPELDANHFLEVLGADYIADAFEAAHGADPEARLFLNENSVEFAPEKAEGLVALVEDLVADGVPIDGVGIQGHQFSGRPPEPGVIAGLVGAFTDLGLEVAITELDLPLLEAGDLDVQADGYRQIVRECVEAGCDEITMWGVYDGATWLDDFLDREGTSPLLFDDDFEPKPAHDAVIEELLRSGEASGPDPTDGT